MRNIKKIKMINKTFKLFKYNNLQIKLKIYNSIINN